MSGIVGIGSMAVVVSCVNDDGVMCNDVGIAVMCTIVIKSS